MLKKEVFANCLQKNKPQKEKLSEALLILVIAEGFELHPLPLIFTDFYLANVL